MAVPDVIALDIFKNQHRAGIFTTTVPLTVDSDSEILVGVIHKEDYKKLLYQISNEGGVNELDFAFYGAAIDDQSHGTDVPPSPPPDYDGTNKIYFLLPNGIGTVPIDDSVATTVTDNWTWVLITVKRTVSGQDTTGFLYIRGE